MNVMVTGCAGFIGSHVTEEFLDAGYVVHGVECFTYAGSDDNLIHANKHESFSLMKANILSTHLMKSIIEENDIEWVINLAAETHVDNSIKDSEIFIETNVLGTKSLLDACLKTGARLLHFSTDEVYGSAVDECFIETHKLDPRNPYSASKAAAEHMITSYANTYGVEYLMVRPSNNFGPRQHNEKFLPTIIRSIKSGKKIPVYGKGMQEREWMYVKETAKATRFILENADINSVYNVSSNFHMKNIEVVGMVCDLVGKDLDECVEYVEDRPGHDFKYSINPSKLNRLGYDVNNNFGENLKELLDENFKAAQV